MGINDDTKLQALYTKLTNALQVYEECEEQPLQDTNNDGKTRLVYFKHPDYGREIAWKLLSGASNDNNCLNCDRKIHRNNECRKKPTHCVSPLKRNGSLNEKRPFLRLCLTPATQVMYEIAEELSDIVGATKMEFQITQQTHSFGTHQTNQKRNTAIPKKTIIWLWINFSTPHLINRTFNKEYRRPTYSSDQAKKEKR